MAAVDLADFLGNLDRETQRIVRTLRQVVLRTAPNAVEAFRFRTLCYFDPTVAYGALGGNICMIEVKRGQVWLTFILGSDLPDPTNLLTGTAKAKRFAQVPSERHAKSPAIRNLIKASARQASARGKNIAQPSSVSSTSRSNSARNSAKRIRPSASH